MNRALASAMLAGASPRPLAMADFTTRDRTAQAERAWQAELQRRSDHVARHGGSLYLGSYLIETKA